jgi:hypothetical protein
MTPHARSSRSLLGSTLWLRPVEPRDAPRLTAFLNRRDLFRSEGKAGAPAQGSRWLATDVWGAPACVLALETEFPGVGILSFAASGGDAGGFLEALRLLADAARRWTRLTRLVTRPPADLIAHAGLRAAGWTESGPGEWSLDLGNEPARFEAPRAG